MSTYTSTASPHLVKKKTSACHWLRETERLSLNLCDAAGFCKIALTTSFSVQSWRVRTRVNRTTYHLSLQGPSTLPHQYYTHSPPCVHSPLLSYDVNFLFCSFSARDRTVSKVRDEYGSVPADGRQNNRQCAAICH